MENISDESICEAVKGAHINAKASLEKLGMLTLLQKNKIFDISFPKEGDILEEEEEENEEDDCCVVVSRG